MMHSNYMDKFTTIHISFCNGGVGGFHFVFGICEMENNLVLCSLQFLCPRIELSGHVSLGV